MELKGLCRTGVSVGEDGRRGLPLSRPKQPDSRAWAPFPDVPVAPASDSVLLLQWQSPVVTTHQFR